MNNTICALIIINPDWFDAMVKLPQCLSSIEWCNDILICTSKTNSELLEISKTNSKIKLIIQEGNDFATWRTNAIKKCKNDWVLFIDADETVTTELQNEILKTIKDTELSGLAIPRNNYILGRKLIHGGWWPDYVMRLIKVSHFKGYQGELHEQPIIDGKTGHLINGFNHYKHDEIESMVEKTNLWSETEANLMFKNQHPPMKWWRFIRPYVNESFNRLINKLELLDGTEGLIDGIYQGFSKLISYSKLWEKQQNEKSINL